jgi:hypothetical protein
MERRRLSNYTVKKMIKHFVLDITANRTALLLGMSRCTINRYYRLFRELIWEKRVNDREQLLGAIEVDESYFGASRPRGVSCPLKRGRGTLKQPIFGVLERTGTSVYRNCIGLLQKDVTGHYPRASEPRQRII